MDSTMHRTSFKACCFLGVNFCYLYFPFTQMLVLIFLCGRWPNLEGGMRERDKGGREGERSWIHLFNVTVFLREKGSERDGSLLSCSWRILCSKSLSARLKMSPAVQGFPQPSTLRIRMVQAGVLQRPSTSAFAQHLVAASPVPFRLQSEMCSKSDGSLFSCSWRTLQ